MMKFSFKCLMKNDFYKVDLGVRLRVYQEKCEYTVKCQS